MWTITAVFFLQTICIRTLSLIHILQVVRNKSASLFIHHPVVPAPGGIAAEASHVAGQELSVFSGNIQLRLKEPFDDNLKRLNEDMEKLFPTRDIVFSSFQKVQKPATPLSRRAS